uniref:G_PROTEIN_RECEP_F1_2 domain-containing protein n=1 Tax=Steinernema glaseri TaxID=37863 RepID=A0A1I7YKA9_9BILA
MEYTAEQLHDSKIASIVIMILGSVGIVVNLHVILALRRTKTFGYTFGRICMSHTVANFGNAFVFTCYVAPITLINPDFHRHYLGIRAGQVLILFWNASVLSHFLTALNRWVVMHFPLKVDHIFTRRVTDILVTFLWIFSICQVIPYFSTECLFDYHIDTFTFTFGSSPCSIVVGTYTDYYFSIVMICSIASLDFMTFIKIRIMHNKTKKAALTNDMQRRRRKEIKFFFQAVCQGVAFMTELVSFFYICLQFENKWIRFCFTTCAWLFVHMVDGLIVIGFNKEVRSYRVFNMLSSSTLHGSSNCGGVNSNTQPGQVASVSETVPNTLVQHVD